MRLSDKLLWKGLCSLFIFACTSVQAIPILPFSSTFTVTTTSDTIPTGKPGELRWAIQQSNANPPPSGLVNQIIFNIPGTGPFRIQPITDLDAVTSPVLIDGYSQPGAQVNIDPFASNAILLIEINGSNYTVGDGISSGAGLTIINDGNTETIIRGLVLNEWILAGIIEASGVSNAVVGNFIGTNTDGTQALANQSGILVSFVDNMIIGSADPADRNVIAGSFSAFVGSACISVSQASVNIKGNLIGTDKTGTSALGNSQAGISLSFTSAIIGGTTPAERNIISGQSIFGIDVKLSISSSSSIQGNYIGTDVTGKHALGNLNAGIHIVSPNNLITNNLISGNGNGIQLGFGFLLLGFFPTPLATGNTIENNLIGTDESGTKKLSNARYGIVIENGDNVVQNNVISGNKKSGLLIYSSLASNVLVFGNFIGTDITGKFALGNGENGIQIGMGGPFGFANNNFINGPVPSKGNVISGNRQNGILVQSHSSDNVIQNNILGLDVTGTVPIPNGGKNIKFRCSKNNVVIGNITDGK